MIDPQMSPSEEAGGVEQNLPPNEAVSADLATLIARGVAAAVEPEGGLEAVQVSLLGAVTEALMDEEFTEKEIGKIMGGNAVRLLMDLLP